ncbi:TAXI family TRAP transporter solute-binding subunit [Prosthecodimorpha staleyi]|uniref:TAXI family TRAP transporter solute-binding subunit n=1 Tax=Prosthecodimorpha staleyi TaxID=2840188 RepID=A0A947D8K0_9HYPH|nr:TAXI family TRAP transporter solute-binding subunit [Prosthecodimorpha staleyi]MBT9290017.1 TAXI family TRAP transporter solute-binding subunit [Prosthecodimorpha staleyi]
MRFASTWKSVRLALAAASLALGTVASASAQTIEWSSGSPGGAWFTQTTGVSAIVMESIPGLNIRVVPGGGKDNPSRIQAGISQIAMGIDFLSKAARDGSDPYKQPMDKVRTLGSTGVAVYFMVYVQADETRSLDKILADPTLKIGVTPQSTSEYLTLQRALAFYGNSAEKIRAGGGKMIVSAYSELIQGFNDGQFDVLWTAGEIPSGIASQVQDGRRKTKLLPFPAELSKDFAARFGYAEATIKNGSFPALQSADLPVTAMGNLYLVSADLPDDLVYKITKAIIDNRARLPNIYQAMKGYDPADAWTMRPVPLHPGAEKAYRDAGFLK